MIRQHLNALLPSRWATIGASGISVANQNQAIISPVLDWALAPAGSRKIWVPGIIASMDYENGTDQATLANAQSDAVGPPIQSITIGAGNSLIYDATNPLTVGSKSAKHVLAGTAASAYWEWTTNFPGRGQTDFFLRAYFQMSNWTTSRIFRGLQGATGAWRITIATTGVIQLQAGTTPTATSTTAISAGTTFRIEAHIDHNNNIITCRLFVGSNSEGDVPDEEFVGSGTAFGAAFTDTFIVGPDTTTAMTYWSDAVKLAVGDWVGAANPPGAGATPAITPAGISAASTVSGSIVVQRAIKPAAVAATSTVSGNVVAQRRIAPAAVTATSTVSGSVRVIRRIPVAQILATSVVSGAIRVIRRITPGQILATSTVSGAVARLKPITPAQILATSTVTGGVVRVRHFAGVISATSTVSGAVTALRRLIGAIAATSTVTGSLRVIRAIRPAAIAATSTVTGVVRNIVPITPAGISATSIVSGALVARRRITGAISATSTVSGSIRLGGKFSGITISATSVVSGSIRVIRRISGVVSATSTVSGSLHVIRRISGQITATSVVSGKIGRIVYPSGAISATSTVSGRVVVLRIIQPGQISATSILTGRIGIRKPISGVISATSTVTGDIHLRANIRGVIFATSTVSGTLRVSQIIYGKATPRIISAREDIPEIVSTRYDEIPILERAR